MNLIGRVSQIVNELKITILMVKFLKDEPEAYFYVRKMNYPTTYHGNESIDYSVAEVIDITQAMKSNFDIKVFKRLVEEQDNSVTMRITFSDNYQWVLFESKYQIRLKSTRKTYYTSTEVFLIRELLSMIRDRLKFDGKIIAKHNKSLRIWEINLPDYEVYTSEEFSDIIKEFRSEFKNFVAFFCCYRNARFLQKEYEERKQSKRIILNK